MPFFMSLHAGNLELVILCFTCCLFTRKFSTWEQNLLQGWSSSLSSSPQVRHHRLCLNFWYFVRTKYAMPWNFPFSFSHMMSVFMNCVCGLGWVSILPFWLYLSWERSYCRNPRDHTILWGLYGPKLKASLIPSGDCTNLSSIKHLKNICRI